MYFFELMFSFSSEKYPEVELLDHILALSLIFEETPYSFTVAVPVYIYTNSIPEFLFSVSIDWDDYNQRYEDPGYWETYDSQYREGRVLLQPFYINNLGSDTRELLRSFGGSFNPIGFPSDSGASGSSISPRMEIGIAAGSKLQDVCWEFLKYLLGEEFQSTADWSLPVRRSALEQQVENALPSPYGQEYLDYMAQAVAEGVADESELAEDYYARELTRDKLQPILDLMERVTVVQRDWTEVVKIISEEADTFFAGQKTAQAAADIIQSRVQIYISENS